MLVVEDEMLLAMDMEMLFEEQGCEMVGSARSVERALAFIEEHRPDAVSLDMNLNGESSAPVAAALRERGIPFLVVTGYSGNPDEDPVFRDAPLVRKPADSAQFVRVLLSLFT